VILSQGRLAAEGSVQSLLASKTGGARYVVEAEGNGVAESLAALPGVSSHSAEGLDGRMRVTIEAAGDHELRPEIFALARDRGWTLWELHRERASLEQLFRSLTAEAPPSSAAAPSEAASAEAAAESPEVQR
jgi:ABC-2 type transport system ATP-binding protein